MVLRGARCGFRRGAGAHALVCDRDLQAADALLILRAGVGWPSMRDEYAGLYSEPLERDGERGALAGHDIFKAR